MIVIWRNNVYNLANAVGWYCEDIVTEDLLEEDGGEDYRIVIELLGADIFDNALSFESEEQRDEAFALLFEAFGKVERLDIAKELAVL